MARIVRRTTTPVATGERLVAHYSMQQLLEDGTVDILQCDLNRVRASPPSGRWERWPRRPDAKWPRMPARDPSIASPSCTWTRPCLSSSLRRSALARKRRSRALSARSDWASRPERTGISAGNSRPVRTTTNGAFGARISRDFRLEPACPRPLAVVFSVRTGSIFGGWDGNFPSFSPRNRAPVNQREASLFRTSQ